MIVIKIEMWPQGDSNRAQEFARAYITNDGIESTESSGAYGDYRVRLYGGTANKPELLKRLWRTGFVRTFDRKRKGIWDLLYQALYGIVGTR
jgi:hypothetical protein